MASLASTVVLEAVLRRDRVVISLLLIVMIAACWLYLLAGAGTGMYPHNMADLVPEMKSITMSPVSWTPGYALLMFSMWWFMMIAMMLPSAAPMVLLHAAITRKELARAQENGSQIDSRRVRSATIVFTGGYLAIWGIFSLAAVSAQWALEREALLTAMMMPTSQALSAVLLLAAGVWQFTPLKTMCLRHCRSPIHFLSTHWHPGVGGAFRIGLQHGVFCVGCCWFLMALLFFGGVMNLVWIIGLALFVLIEKILPSGVAFGKVTGLLLVGWGGWLGFS